VSSSDIAPIGKFARDITRQYRLEKTDAPEEFFKLCLDMGLGLMTAESVMRSVKQIRWNMDKLTLKYVWGQERIPVALRRMGRNA
jgi:hypothetical protein